MPAGRYRSRAQRQESCAAHKIRYGAVIKDINEYKVVLGFVLPHIVLRVCAYGRCMCRHIGLHKLHGPAQHHLIYVH